MLIIFFLALILKYFHSSMMTSCRLISLVFVLPVLYISLVERAIRDMIYGNTVIADRELGIIFPVVNHMELLFLQLFASFSLFFLLTAWKRLTKSLLKEQALQLLKQQAKVQETYILEARLREEQTRSFRHDIKNHLTVLSGLLKEGCTKQAYNYLANLEPLSSSLSYPVHIGNPAVDALLGSKFAIAQQKHISLQWELRLPDHSSISDVDWCIVFSNGMDNAIRANDDIAEEKKFILIIGKKKGNFYLLSIENACDEALNQEPEYGTGLSNIKAVMDRNQGIMETMVSNGRFKLNLLFLLSQHPDDISRQNG
ncbi:GHKL domain-containing protein [Lachnospiraceae bacterium 62-35]